MRLHSTFRPSHNNSHPRTRCNCSTSYRPRITQRASGIAPPPPDRPGQQRRACIPRRVALHSGPPRNATTSPHVPILRHIRHPASASASVMSRQRSPAPPTLPPKDSSSSLASSYRRSNYVNNDLAEAVRDSVQFGSKQSSPNIDFSDPSGFKQRPSSSLNPPVPRRTPSPRLPINNERPQNGASDDYYNNHNNRVSFVPAMMGQPQLPSQRVISAQNPFESDEIEPPPGPLRPPGVQAAAGRQKLARAQTAQGAK